MNNLKFLLFLLLLLITPSVYNAQKKKNAFDSAGSFQTDLKTAKSADNYLTNAEALGYSGIVLWAKNGKIILKKGYGFADRSAKTRMSPKTIFDMGSVTKMFTAAAILKLEEQGKLSVSDSIAKFFDNLPADKAKITVHHLLSHSSGIPFDTIADRPLDAASIDYALIKRDDFVKRVSNSDLRFSPGKDYLYSNDGYGLLAVIIEKLSGMSYEAFLNKEIFKPAGMSKTGYIIPRWNKKEIARGYRYEEEYPTPLGYPWLKDGPGWNLRGNGGLLTTVDDLYRWHLALEGEKILSKTSKQKMFTPYFSTDKEQKDMYGYGWHMTKVGNGISEIYHSGGNGQFAVFFRRFPKNNSVIIEVTNHSTGPAFNIIRNLHSWIIEEKVPSLPGPPLKVETARLLRYTGTYEVSLGRNFDIKYQNGKLFIEGDAPGISGAISFPEKLDEKSLTEYESITSRVIYGLANQNFQPLYDILWRDSSREEEESFWRKQWKIWEMQYGKYISSKVLGARAEKDTLDLYVAIQFLKGKQTIIFQKNPDKLFYVNVSSKTSRIVPILYWLSPKSDSEFTAYNFELKKGVILKFQDSGGKSVSGVDISGENVREFAKKIT